MSDDSVSGPAGRPAADPIAPTFVPQAGAPGGQPGPYGPGGPGWAPGVPGFDGPGGPSYGGPGGPPPKKGRGGLIAGLAVAGVVVVAGVVFAGVTLFGGTGGTSASSRTPGTSSQSRTSGTSANGGFGSARDLDALPAPKALGHDPVPPERKIKKKPAARCGVSAATLRALLPGKVEHNKYASTCGWDNITKRNTHDLRFLDVDYSVPDTGFHVASKDARAIGQFQSATDEKSDLVTTAPKRQTGPLTGLGDEALYSVGQNQGQTEAWVVFRAGDQARVVRYTGGYQDPSASKRYLRGALRVASEVAKGIGVRAHPVRVRAKRLAPVAVPRDVCGLVPKDLMKKLAGAATPVARKDGDDQVVADDVFPGETTSGCIMTAAGRSASRILDVHVTGATKPVEDGPVTREYLAAYYEDRASKSYSTTGKRYFHPLTGLGDKAFGSYVGGQRERSVIEDDAAEVVVRSGTALITVRFGAKGPNARAADVGLTEKQTIKAAYAVAVKVAAGVK